MSSVLRKPRRASPAQAGDDAYAAPALEKGLDILELLTLEPAGRALTQTQIATALKRSKSEIFRMLVVLQRRGYVRRVQPGDAYRLTARLFEMSHRHTPTAALLDAALPAMRELALETSQSCHLAVADGEQTIAIAKADSPEPRGFSVRIGAAFPLGETASGLVLMAFADPATSAGRRAEGAPPATRERLAAIARRGFERARSRTLHGIIDLSYPVLDHHGHAVAAVTLPYLTRRGMKNDVESTQRRLARAATIISQAIGGGGGGESPASPFAS